MKKFFVILASITGLSAYSADSCDSWLKRTGAKPGALSCEIDCSSASVDLGTFDCQKKCSTYCNAKCSQDPFWENPLKFDPAPFKMISGAEKKILRNALSRIPKSMQTKFLKSLAKASGPDFFSPSNPATSMPNGQIVFFPRAFASGSTLERIIVHELSHLLLSHEWVKDFDTYKTLSGWSKAKTARPRAGDFVEADGKDSAEEDFANSIEYFLFEPEKLEKVSPAIYAWISKTLGKQLKLGDSCER